LARYLQPPQLKTGFLYLRSRFSALQLGSFLLFGFCLYTLMGISLYIIWEKVVQQKEVKIGLLIFGIQLGLNIIWSYLFFGIRSPYYAFIEIILLWFAILLTIIQFRKISKTASYLLLPYILWVSFAMLLNYNLWILNS